MEEKKEIRISLSTCLLTIAVIVIIVMAVFIYKMYNEKASEINKIDELSNEIYNLKEKIGMLDSNVEIDTTSNKSSNGNQTNNQNKKDEFTNEEIKEAIQNYLDLLGTSNNSPSAVVEYLFGYENVKLTWENDHMNEHYTKTNIEYNKFKNEILNYMTEEAFSDFNGEEYIKRLFYRY